MFSVHKLLKITQFYQIAPHQNTILNCNHNIYLSYPYNFITNTTNLTNSSFLDPMHNNPETYVNHQLNTSTTKQTFSFSKAPRFKAYRNILADSMYQLPSSITNRTCSFGYGNKISIVGRDKSPPPGAYQSISDFNNAKITRYNTISFSLGRNKVKFGSFLGQAESKKKNPSPNAYRIKTTQYYSTKGGRMAAKLPSQIDLVIKKRTPGPGAYKLDVTEMKGSGTYILSNFVNNLSPKYLSPNSRSRSRSPQNSRYSLGPGQYDINHQKFGQSIVSKFKNSVNSSFTKERRPGPDDKSKRNFPGFKYKRFSQFCGTQK